MVLRGQKSKLTNLRFLYSQDLSNCTTLQPDKKLRPEFLYSQDLSKCTTECEGMEVEEVELVLELCCFEWSQNYYLYDITEYFKKEGVFYGE